MKNKFSVVLTTLVLIGLTATTFAAFTVDVKIGSADAGVSLTFGEGEDEVQPFPPFSAMFGVKDVFLANSSNYTDLPDISGDMSRLSVDKRKNADKWVIIANSNASLIFEMSGASEVYVTFIDPKTSELKSVTVENNGTLPVKGGVQYTISRTENTEVATVSEDPNNLNVVATKDAEGTYAATKELEVAAGHNYTVYFATPNAVNSDSADWEVDITNAENLVFADDGYSATFTATADTVDVTVTAASGSSSAITATVVDNDDARKVAAINAILQKFGTLDFDGDNKININDVMYLYNYMAAGGEVESADELSAGTTVTDAERLATALNNLQGNADGLDYDQDSKLNINDVMYLYNYMAAGGEVESADELSAGTTVTDEGRLANALENLNDQKE